MADGVFFKFTYEPTDSDELQKIMPALNARQKVLASDLAVPGFAYHTSIYRTAFFKYIFFFTNHTQQIYKCEL